MNSFFLPEEETITNVFLRNGYIVQQAEDMKALNYIQAVVTPFEPDGERDLNALKLDAMRILNTDPKARLGYYSLARSLLQVLVGNELAMQKKFNINVQVPHDAKNLLPIHADTWTGDSPFQVVLWVPLVDCYGTKAMWILPPKHMKHFKLEGSSEEMFRRIEPYIEYVPVKYGEVLVFNSTLPHGNRLNVEDSTRWSLNCRFQSVFAPYGKKELGEHFEPITLRAASRIGMAYRHP